MPAFSVCLLAHFPRWHGLKTPDDTVWSDRGTSLRTKGTPLPVLLLARQALRETQITRFIILAILGSLEGSRSLWIASLCFLDSPFLVVTAAPSPAAEGPTLVMLLWGRAVAFPLCSSCRLMSHVPSAGFPVPVLKSGVWLSPCLSLLIEGKRWAGAESCPPHSCQSSLHTIGWGLGKFFVGIGICLTFFRKIRILHLASVRV